MRVLLIAPPGAGKGTQGGMIAAHFGLPHIATGDLLRDHVARQTELGRAVRQLLESGELVPDDIVVDMVLEAIVAAKAAGGGYVLDGIPRNIAQARATYLMCRGLGMTPTVALHLRADDQEVTHRLLARAAIERRSDDTEEVIRRRLAVYHEVTHPILGWYAERGIVVTVDAMRPVDQVAREILDALEKLRPVAELAPGQAPPAIDLDSLGTAFGAEISG